MWAEKEGVRRGRACVERTENMLLMSVTLDVSRVSGWLNALASCAESKRTRVMRKRGRMWAEKEGVRRGRACVERTQNMSLMSVTLDVSRVSGWLNALAHCAESKGSA